jgi:hypothetical protein
MNMHAKIRADECSAEVSDRTATLQRNDLFPRMPWQIRCYGSGRCTHGDGVPNRFNNRDRAAQAAEMWIETGIAPADQWSAHA